MRVRHTNGFVTFEIADDSSLALMIQKRDLVEQADRVNGHLPQYVGHWDDWTLVRVLRDVTTKFGRAFVKGEVALGKFSPAGSIPGVVETDEWSVYSPSNGIDTVLPVRYVEEIA